MRDSKLTKYFLGSQANKKNAEDDQVKIALGRFFQKINFQTEEETLEPVNIELAKNAFKALCAALEWDMVETSFDELLSEKSGDEAFRDDKKTPNWYHEFRQILPILSMIKNDTLPLNALNKHGGIEPLLAGKLRHDSWEDFGKSSFSIYAEFEEKAHEFDDPEYSKRVLAAASLESNINLATRKTPEGVRYNGDLNEFYHKMSSNPMAIIIKYSDSDEGVTTRIMPNTFSETEGNKFSVDRNIKYVRERRQFYGNTDLDQIVINKDPDLANCMKALDGMLGTNMTILETINQHYDEPEKFNPYHALPVRPARYQREAAKGFEHVPRGYRGDYIQIDRAEKQAATELNLEGAERMRLILDNAIYPTIENTLILRKAEPANDIDEPASELTV